MIRFHIDGLIFGLQPHGGISRVFTNLINAFSRRHDCEVTLYLPYNLKTNLVIPQHARTVTYPRLSQLRPSRVFTRWNRSREYKALTEMWSTAKSGVYLSSHYSTYDGIKLPQMQIIQDMIYESLPKLFASEKDRSHINDKRQCANAASAIVAPSSRSLQDASSAYDLSGKRTRIIPYAIDDVFRKSPSIGETELFRQRYSKSKPFILHTGSRYLHKNFAALMAAFSHWDKRHDFQLINVGGGAIKPEEAAMATGLGIADRVHMVSGLSDDELVIAYHAASAFVFPSLYEGFGFPVIEAISAGLPAAVSNASCLPEVGGGIPWYFDPTDSQQLLSALDQALSEPAQSSRIDAGRDRVFSFNWDDVAQQFVSLAEQMVATN